MAESNVSFALGFNPHVEGEARDKSMHFTPYYEHLDDDESFHPDNASRWMKLRGECHHFAEATGLLDITRLFPIIKWGPEYTKSKLTGDVVAGLTTGLMVIPQGMAYASIAGLPPVYGLYSAFMGCMVYFVTGTSKDISLGPTALMSLILAESFTELEHPLNATHITEDVAGLNLCSAIESDSHCCLDSGEYMCTPVKMAVAVTMMSGIVQVLMGVLNFGFIIDYIGFHVLNGFTTAAAITIAFSQLKHIFGMKDVSREFFHVEGGHVGGAVVDIFQKLPETRWEDFSMGIAAMLFTWLLEKLKLRYDRIKDDSYRNKVLWLLGTARNAVVVIGGLVVARLVSAADSLHLKNTTELAGDDVFSLVGIVPAGLPTPGNPFAGEINWTELGTASITISLLGYLESIAIGKTFAQKNGYRLDSTQELRAIGLANIASSFFSSFPITGSFSRTAVNAASNVESPMGGVFSGLVVIISLVALTPIFYFIPKAALASIILMSIVHMIDVPTVRRIGRTRGMDLVVWCTSFFLCLFWSLEFGILVAVGVSMILEVVTTKSQGLSRLRIQDNKWKVDRSKGTSGLAESWGPRFVEGRSCTRSVTCDRHITIKPQGSLTFAMTTVFKDRVTTILAQLRSTEHVTALFIDFSSSPTIDFTGVLAIQDLLQEAKPGTRKSADARGKALPYQGTLIYASRLPAVTHGIMERSGVFNGRIEYGGWPLLERWTTMDALDSFDRDATAVLAIYPHDWLAPAHPGKKAGGTTTIRPFEHPVGWVATGRDDLPWTIHNTVKSPTSMEANRWIRELTPAMLEEAQKHITYQAAEDWLQDPNNRNIDERQAQTTGRHVASPDDEFTHADIPSPRPADHADVSTEPLHTTVGHTTVSFV